MIKKIVYVLLLIILIVVFSCRRPPAPNPPHENGYGDSTSYLIVEIKDGDTIELDDGQVVRLVGIDTPEMNYGGTPEPCAVEAKHFNEVYVLNKRCYLIYNTPVGDSLDAYGRTLAFVHILPDSLCLNVEICRAGWSENWDRYPVRTDYEILFEEAEAEAITANRGIWDSENNCD